MNNINEDTIEKATNGECEPMAPQPGECQFGLPDPERGDRLTVKRNELHKLHLLSTDEKKEVLYGLWCWMEGASEESVVAEFTDRCSTCAVVILTMLIDNQKIRAEKYFQRVESQALRMMRRVDRSRCVR